jgi:hypothetical protein
VGERVWHHLAFGLSLQPIIAYGRSRLQRRFNVSGFNKLPLWVSAVCPYTGKAISLQLNSDLQAIGFDLVHPALRLLNLWQHSKLVLHMMPDLMGNHIGLRELAGLASDVAHAKALLEVLKEACVGRLVLIRSRIASLRKT